MQHPLVYEINTRCWLSELSARAGHRVTLADVPEREFQEWTRCGFTHVWLMGVWQLGRRGVRHSRKVYSDRVEKYPDCEVAGSPYAITGYKVSRTLGGETAFANFRQKLNTCGIKLILDFVPNHTALDHPWVKAHPEFYVTSDSRVAHAVKPFRGATKWFAHGHCGFGEPWADTLQLDFRNPALRRAMIEELLSVSSRCDGVRCDMAMLALNEVFTRTWRNFPAPHEPIASEFWSEAISVVREQREGFLFLAEVYWDLEARLQELGFDFTYDKRLYDRLVAGDARETVRYVHSFSREFLQRSTHFIENHDEPRIASLLSAAEQRAAALLIATLPGMRFFHDGQLSGRRVHASVHFASRRAEAEDADLTAFYFRLFEALSRSAVGRGDWQLLCPQPAWAENTTHENIALVQWRFAKGIDLAVVNLASTQSQCYVPMKFEGLPVANWRLTDLVGVEVHVREGKSLHERGLYLDLPPHAAQLFHFEAIP